MNDEGCAPPVIDIAGIDRVFGTAAAVRLALEARVFERLDGCAEDASTLAAGCGLAPVGAALLLEALAELGLLERVDGHRYRSRLAELEGIRALSAVWDDLPSTLRGERARVGVDRSAGAEALYPAVAPCLATMFAGAAERAADILAERNLRVLDVGCGAAPWSIAIARRDRGTRVTAVDLPGVLPVARSATQRAGLSDSFELLPGDIFSVDWGRDRYDLAIVANICHLFDEPANRVLLDRVRLGLRPGGTLAIIDVLPDTTSSPVDAALYQVGLYVRSATGRAYPSTTYTGWLRESGFGGVDIRDLAETPPISLVVARRAG